MLQPKKYGYDSQWFQEKTLILQQTGKFLLGCYMSRAWERVTCTLCVAWHDNALTNTHPSGLLATMTDLQGMAFRKRLMGRGPAVYLLMKKGSSTCSGLMGTAISASRSLGTPASTNFRPVTASAAEKPI